MRPNKICYSVKKKKPTSEIKRQLFEQEKIFANKASSAMKNYTK